jgi:predicted MFS family arabinose efflux permease
MSSLILQPNPTSKQVELLKLNEIQLKIKSEYTNVNECGCNDCGTETSTDLIIKPTISSVNLLLFSFIIIGSLAILLIKMKMKNIDQIKEKKKRYSEISTTTYDLLTSTFRLFKNVDQLLMIPSTLWLGFELAFIHADFNKSFIACFKGVNYVGYPMIFYGFSNAGGCYLFGILPSKVGRYLCVLFAILLNYLCLFMMVNVEIKTFNDDWFFFLIPILWGFADSSTQIQIHSVYALLFHDCNEAGFSNFLIIESIGFAFSYYLSAKICMITKIYLMLFYLTCHLIGYSIIELKLKKKKMDEISIKN